VQNIAEGSLASATSKKMELKLTQVARASLEELKLDYEDFLRQRGLAMLEPSHAALTRFKKHKPQTVAAFAAWVEEERQKNTDGQGQTQTGKDSRIDESSVPVGAGPCQSLSSSCLAANGALSLLNLACYLLERQVAQLADTFEKEGGFTERLYRVRTANRRTKG